jgi:hypothetical protein
VIELACACSKNRTSQNAARGIQYVYDFTAPGSEVVTTFMTTLEAKRAVRQNGGGVIRRRQTASAPAA